MGIVNDIDFIKNCDPIFKSKIVLYGSGYYGRKAAGMLRKLNIPVEAVCTTTKEDPLLIKGIRYINVSELKQMDDRENVLIVIATIVCDFMEQIMETLDQYRITRGMRITYLGLRYACLLNKKIDKRGELAYEWELWSISLESAVRYETYVGPWYGFSENAVWVYTVGKVGSATISKSLESLRIPNAHIHELEETRMKTKGVLYLDGRRKTYEHGFKNHDLFLEKIKKQKHIQIITLVREPIARDISRYFQSFYTEYTAWLDQTNDLYKDFIRMTKGFLKDRNQFVWFNQEIKKVFGIDVYEYPFDKEKGYALIEEDNISILILKMEKLNELESVVGEFLKIENFELVNANEAKDRPYRYMYEEFKQNVKLPQSYVDSYYKDNPYMDHFYSEKEKAKFLDKWSRRLIKD